MTKCSGASLLEKGLTVIWTLCRGAAAKETSLGTAWKSCCQKTETPEQCRCLEQMAGHSCPKIEKITFLVQSRNRKTSNKPIQVLFPSLQFIPATSAFARLGWHHSGLHLATDTLKCPQHKSYSHLQGRATRPQALRNRERRRKSNRGMAVTLLLEGRIKDMHVPKKSQS